MKSIPLSVILCSVATQRPDLEGRVITNGVALSLGPTF
jgi:hypothetical protein